MTKRTEEKSQRLHQQRGELYSQIHDLAAKKIMVVDMARQLGVSCQTIYRYLQMKQPPERTRINLGGQRLIDPYKNYLLQRWNEGCRSAQQMYREIKEQGYTGSSTAVGRFCRSFASQEREGSEFQVSRARSRKHDEPRGREEKTASYSSPSRSLDEF